MKLPKKRRSSDEEQRQRNRLLELFMLDSPTYQQEVHAVREALLELERETARSEEMSDLRAEQLQAVRNRMASELQRRSAGNPFTTATYQPAKVTTPHDEDLDDYDDEETYEEDAYADYTVQPENGEALTQAPVVPVYDEFGELEALQADQQRLQQTLTLLNNSLAEAHASLRDLDLRLEQHRARTSEARSRVVINHVDCPCCGMANMPMTDGTIFCNNKECGAYRPLPQDA